MKTLTVEDLGAMKMTTVMHLNGGSKFSRLVRSNDEWDLALITETDGRPNFVITAKELQHSKGDAAVDITPPLEHAEVEKRLTNFCANYNQEREPQVSIVK